jgi:ParB family chromosome partitioning protein
VAKSKKKGLGKGLGALLGNTAATLDKAPAPAAATPAVVAEGLPDGSTLLSLDPTEIEPNPKQPRLIFDEEALQDLAASIKMDGVQEPVIVRKTGDKYELVSGERRVRASIMADMDHIPAVCRVVSDQDMLKLGIIENIQREDLNAIELAKAYEELRKEFNWTQEELAKEVGKNRVTVTNTLRLLNLPEAVQQLVGDGELTMGHAKALLAIEKPNEQIRAAHKIIAQGLSVRQAEQLGTNSRPPKAKKQAAPKDPNVSQIEDTLRRCLGTKVALKAQSGQKGKIEIEYFNLDELERILEILQRG